MRIVLAIPGRPVLPRRVVARTSPGHRRAAAVLFWLSLISAGFGAATGYFVRLDMPSLSALEDYSPPQMTRLLDHNGGEFASFASEKRLLLGDGDIPRSFRLALIASEDSRFDEHAGVDLLGVARAVLSDLRAGRMAQGASTLTMQLAGNLYLDRSQRTVRRKLQEAFLALEIERRFSKQEILRMYTNQVHFGHGLYGLEAAARYYFGKTARELSVGESATLVGLLPRPARYSPFRDPVRARERRNIVLRRMVDEGYLGPDDADRLAAEPIVLAKHSETGELAPYFTEGVRRWLQDTYGDASLYRGGMSVRTTLDRRLQQAANRAVQMGVRELDRRQGWRPEQVRRVPRDQDPHEWVSPDWRGGVAPGQVTDGVVLEVNERRALVRVGETTAELLPDAIRWTGRTRPDRLVHAGDVIRVGLTEKDGRPQLTLEQRPLVQAALIALDPGSGAIRALVGGVDFERSEYDRATQARRQPGSLFKPFVYAAALSNGWTLADTIVDGPTVFLDPRNPVPYQPENFSRTYHGTVTLRFALEKSINIATVKLMERLGYEPVLDIARRLGVRSPLQPYPSLALGAFELTLLEVTRAYGAFANQGLLFEPYWIEEADSRSGDPVFRARARVSEAVSPQVAYLMNRALAGVVQNGTGHRAGEELRRTLAGKTGTTDDNTDAWFVGYSPHLAVGVWVGYDEPKSLGNHETGARAALPIWIEFMRQALAGTPDEAFPVPPGVRSVPIDSGTGKRPSVEAGCENYIVESFIEGTEPGELCTRETHARQRLPHAFQHYRLDVDGSLMIPHNELERALAFEPDVAYERDSRTLVSWDQLGLTEIKVKELADVTPAEERLPPDLREERWRWLGTDGREARLIWFGDRVARRRP